MTGKNFCELCGEAGLSSRLVPYQMNAEEALLICENVECVYPLGTSRVGNFVVSRKATEISNTKRKRKKTLLQQNTEDSSFKSTQQFINWENVDALCWLDCALSLLVHNQTFKTLVGTVQSPNSLLRSLLESYTKAQQLSSSDLSSAKTMLDGARHTVWTYLAPKMKCSLGVNDSPVFAIPLLLRENIVTLENCLQEYTWKFNCSSCGYTEQNRQKKYIVTFPNTPNGFDLQHGSFLRTCPTCNSVEQKTIILYEKMPDVVVMHFVEGLKSQDYLASKFMFDNNLYKLTQFIQYSRNPDHFICWSKECYGTRWLELDDLKPPVCSWSNNTPMVPPSEVHIVVFEKITLRLSQDTASLAEDKLTKSGNGVITQIETYSVPSNKEIPRSCIDTTGVIDIPDSNDTNCMSSPTPLEVENMVPKTALGQGSLLDKSLIRRNLDERQKEIFFGQNNPHSKSSEFELLRPKPVLNECSSPPSTSVSEIHCDISGSFSLNECSNTSGEDVNTLDPNLPTPTLYRCDNEPVTPQHSLSILPSSLNSPSLENSFIKVALKRQSSCKKFQPSLNTKRRALSCKFQPYVPKKQRLESPSTLDKPSSNDFDHQSDSGYSSPSSVGSCGSASSAASIETEHKISVTEDIEKMEIDDHDPENIAEELEKLLPDCLLNAHSKRMQIVEDQVVDGNAMELTSVSQEQDDFIKSLLFDD